MDKTVVELDPRFESRVDARIHSHDKLCNDTHDEMHALVDLIFNGIFVK